MKSNILAAATLTLIASTLLASCDDFLDVRPKSEKVERDLFSNADGFESAIYGVYGAMAANNLYGRNLLWGVTEVMAQNLAVNTTEMRALASFQYEENNDLRTRFAYIWSSAYQAIGYANNVLTNIDSRGGGLPLRDIYRGEMLAVRAFLHFDLLRLFCSATDTTQRGLPYPTAYAPIMNDFNTVGATYRLILADLLEAEQLLREAADIIVYPRDNSQYYAFQQRQETHANYYAVLGILAKVHWTMGNMTEAARYARMVIDSGKFPLAEPSEVPDLFAGKISDKETLWGLYSTTYNETAQSYLYNYQTFHSYDPYTSTSGSSYQLPYQTVYARNVESTVQDYRLQWFRQGTSYARCLKVCDYHTLDGTGIPTGWSDRLSGINLLHVSELYIIAADALLDSDPVAALTLYNAETASRGLPARRQDEGLTHDIISEEYHKEMFCEGQVWFNMKRRNMDIASNYENRTVPASESVYTVPIPQDEITYRN